jgi:flagella basal body P-ring formation protein FlgA
MHRHARNLIAALLLAAAAWGAAWPARASREALESTVRLAVERESGEGVRIAIEFPEAPTPHALSACRQAEPFVPTNARLWGRTVVGVRCVDGPPVAAYLPVVIRVYAQAVTATRNLAAGIVLAPEDLVLAEVELTAGPGSVLTDTRHAVGSTLVRATPMGTALRRDSLRAAHAIVAGDIVRLLYSGPGFSVSADARALAAAQEGQSVRVQTESGRVLSGVAKSGRVVEIRAY